MAQRNRAYYIRELVASRTSLNSSDPNNIVPETEMRSLSLPLSNCNVLFKLKLNFAPAPEQ